MVAVLDTGVDYPHSDLAADIWANEDASLNGADEDGNGKIDDVSVSAFTHGNDACSQGAGTSFSAPYDTGLAALILGSNPGMTGEELGAGSGKLFDKLEHLF